MAPPNLKSLLEVRCPNSQAPCIPYGLCCSMHEFCNLHKRDCSSCFPYHLKTNESKLEFCQEAQYNVSQMVHSSCKAACDDYFGRKAFLKDDNDGEDNGKTMIIAIAILGILCVGMFIFIIYLKLGLISKCCKKCLRGRKDNVDTKDDMLHIGNSKEDVDVKKKIDFRKEESEKPLLVSPDETDLMIAHDQRISRGGEKADRGADDTVMASQPREVETERTVESPPSTNQAGQPEACSVGPPSPNTDCAKNRAVHMPETNSNSSLPSEIVMK